MTDVITVDFKQPIPLFPLPSVVLLPHSMQGLHVFEPRYRQMVEHCLRRGRGNLLRSGQIAMAVVRPDALGDSGWEGLPPLRKAVCVGQMVQHEQLPDGRHTIVLHGVCRAEIVEIAEPAGDRLNRQALLAPLETPGRVFPTMRSARRAISGLLHGPRLSRMTSIKAVLPWIERTDLPTHAVVEIVGDAIVRIEETRYRLLEESDPWSRARILRDHLVAMDRLVAAAERQGSRDWPKGLSWN